MNRPFFWFVLGIGAYWVWIHMIAKVPTAAAKPGA